MRQHRESRNVIDIRESSPYSINQQSIDLAMPAAITTLLVASGIILIVVGLVNSGIFSGIRNRSIYK